MLMLLNSICLRITGHAIGSFVKTQILKNF